MTAMRHLLRGILAPVRQSASRQGPRLQPCTDALLRPGLGGLGARGATCIPAPVRGSSRGSDDCGPCTSFGVHGAQMRRMSSMVEVAGTGAALPPFEEPPEGNGDRGSGVFGGETVDGEQVDAVVDPKARVVFDSCWRQLEQTVGLENIVVPREVVWLNGAPGAGKGANTPFIMRTRGFTTRPIECSRMFRENKNVKTIIESGGLVPDSMVVSLLLDTLLNPANESTCNGTGCLVDGFPRTKLQVDCLKLLHDKLVELHEIHSDHTNPNFSRQFPRPVWKIVVLYVEEEESITRQMSRGQAAKQHQKRYKEAGFAPKEKVRATDVDEAACRRRYAVFKEHYGTLLRLKKFFPFHLIDAMGALDQCEKQIGQELRYQSSLELSERTYRYIRGIPLASEIARQSRQELVQRLDHYSLRDKEVFQKVLNVIKLDVLALLWRCSMAGHAEFETSASLWSDHPEAVDMLIDVMSDRGFSVSYRVKTIERPVAVDLKTGGLKMVTEKIHCFRISFEQAVVRKFAPPHAEQAEGDRRRKKQKKDEVRGGLAPIMEMDGDLK